MNIYYIFYHFKHTVNTQKTPLASFNMHEMNCPSCNLTEAFALIKHFRYRDSIRKGYIVLKIHQSPILEQQLPNFKANIWPVALPRGGKQRSGHPGATHHAAALVFVVLDLEEGVCRAVMQIVRIGNITTRWFGFLRRSGLSNILHQSARKIKTECTSSCNMKLWVWVDGLVLGAGCLCCIVLASFWWPDCQDIKSRPLETLRAPLTGAKSRKRQHRKKDGLRFPFCQHFVTDKQIGSALIWVLVCHVWYTVKASALPYMIGGCEVCATMISHLTETWQGNGGWQQQSNQPDQFKHNQSQLDTV